MTQFFPFIQPDLCERKPIRTTKRNVLGQQVMATRKMLEVYHRISYVFDKLSTRQYRILNNFFRNMDGGVTSFYVVDWGDPRVVKSIDGDRVVLNNVDGLTTNSGDGGNRVILWSNSGDYGNDSTVSGSNLTDTSKAWTADEFLNHSLMDSTGKEHNASSIVSNTGTVFYSTKNATPMPGAYDIYQYVNRTIASLIHSERKLTLNASPILTYGTFFEHFALPVYECHFSSDSLEGLEQTGEFNLEANDNYGPFWSGEITFIQTGTGT